MKHATDVSVLIPRRVTILSAKPDVKFDTGDEEESAHPRSAAKGAAKLFFRWVLVSSLVNSYQLALNFTSRSNSLPCLLASIT